MARGRRGSRRSVIAGGVAVVVLAGGGAAFAATRNSGPAYRLSTVTTADVEQTITEVGTISSINQRELSFGVSGTVKSVPVTLGDSVTAGQTVATLDPTDLQQAVDTDTGSVASAKQRLADDEATQAAAGESTDSLSAYRLGSTPSPAPSAGATPTGSPKPGKTSSSISGLQAAVTADQSAVDAGLSTVDSDIKALKTACSTSVVTFTATSGADGILHGTVTGAAGLPISIPSDTDAAGAAIPATTVGSDGDYTFGSTAAPLRANAAYTVQLGSTGGGAVTTSGACTTALQQTSADERTVAEAEHTLLADEKLLDKAVLAARSSSSGGGGSGSGSGSGSSSGSGSGSGSSSGSGSGSGSGSHTGSSATGGSRASGSGSGVSGSGVNGGTASTTITAAQLAADQKTIDAAEAELVVAKQNLAAASLTTPISGTVAAVAITVGTAVSASSSTATITIIGSGQKEVTTTVGISDIDLVKKGDSASVTVDGVSQALPGTVSQVGILNTSGTSGTSSTYPVTVVLEPTDLALYDGAGATVAIHVGTAKNVLTVPTSALSSLGTRAVVTVYAGGKLTRTPVTLGVAGLDRTQVKSGLKAGQRVVLANLKEAAPSSTTTTNRLARLGGGGLTGATFGGGTFTGGGNRGGG